MYEAKRIMTRAVVTVQETTPIYRAMNLLVKYSISGLPVVDHLNRLVGVITEKDMIQLMVNETVPETNTVGHYMTRDVKSFTPETSAVEMSEFFSVHPLRRAPVVDDEGKLVGIVARRDILSIILTIRGQAESIDE
jgi:CBS domain-containing protein